MENIERMRWYLCIGYEFKDEIIADISKSIKALDLKIKQNPEFYQNIFRYSVNDLCQNVIEFVLSFKTM